MIPCAPTQDTPKGKLYSKRQPKRAFRHSQVLRLDATITEALTKAQHLDDLTTSGQVFSRTVIIRRAVLLYTMQLVQALNGNNPRFLENELNTLLSMSTPPKRSPFGK
jgi:hypothetical protein